MAEDRKFGERIERKTRIDRIRYYAVLAGLGGIVGFVFARYEDDSSTWMSGNIPPAVAIVLAAITVTAMVGGCLFVKRRIDEVELQHNLYAGAGAAMAVLIGYPAWFLLWKGRLLPEPSHVVMFLILYGVMAIAYIYRKFR